MPSTSEIRHSSLLIAALTISAARATDEGQLAAIFVSLAEAYMDIFTLLSHDARALRAEAADDGSRHRRHHLPAAMGGGDLTTNGGSS